MKTHGRWPSYINKAAVFLMINGISAYSQHCSSIAASRSGGWQPAKTAPRNGAVVEMMQTYGVWRPESTTLYVHKGGRHYLAKAEVFQPEWCCQGANQAEGGTLAGGA